eukprot:c18486_g1_i1 orf=796-1299(+)
MQMPPSASQLQQTAVPAQIMIKDLRPSALNNINIVFIILEKGAISRNDKGTIMSMNLAADPSAAVHLQLWGNECEFFQPGDIVHMTQGIFSSFNGSMVLRAGRKGKLEKIGEFTMVFAESPNMSKLQWVQEPSNPTKWVPVGLHSPQMPQIAPAGSTGLTSSQRVLP